jgi:hypothetical protein
MLVCSRGYVEIGIFSENNPAWPRPKHLKDSLLSRAATSTLQIGNGVPELQK